MPITPEFIVGELFKRSEINDNHHLQTIGSSNGSFRHLLFEKYGSNASSSKPFHLINFNYSTNTFVRTLDITPANTMPLRINELWARGWAADGKLYIGVAVPCAIYVYDRIANTVTVLEEGSFFADNTVNPSGYQSDITVAGLIGRTNGQTPANELLGVGANYRLIDSGTTHDFGNGTINLVAGEHIGLDSDWKWKRFKHPSKNSVIRSVFANTTAQWDGVSTSNSNQAKVFFGYQGNFAAATMYNTVTQAWLASPGFSDELTPYYTSNGEHFVQSIASNGGRYVYGTCGQSPWFIAVWDTLLNTVIYLNESTAPSRPISFPDASVIENEARLDALYLSVAHVLTEEYPFWDASTNAPALADGVGVYGTVYDCNVGGTVDFGSGPISFNVGDLVILTSGNIWEKTPRGYCYSGYKIAWDTLVCERLFYRQVTKPAWWYGNPGYPRVMEYLDLTDATYNPLTGSNKPSFIYAAAVEVGPNVDDFLYTIPFGGSVWDSCALGSVKSPINIQHLIKNGTNGVVVAGGTYEDIGNVTTKDPLVVSYLGLAPHSMSIYAAKAIDDKIYFSGYPGGPFSVYDPAKPYTNKVVTPSNPYISPYSYFSNPRTVLRWKDQTGADPDILHDFVEVPLNNAYPNERYFVAIGHQQRNSFGAYVARMRYREVTNYRGTWNPNTNVATLLDTSTINLVDGVGTQGDGFRVTSEGTFQDILFENNSSVVYDNGTWQKSAVLTKFSTNPNPFENYEGFKLSYSSSEKKVWLCLDERSGGQGVVQLYDPFTHTLEASIAPIPGVSYIGNLGFIHIVTGTKGHLLGVATASAGTTRIWRYNLDTNTIIFNRIYPFQCITKVFISPVETQRLFLGAPQPSGVYKINIGTSSEDLALNIEQTYEQVTNGPFDTSLGYSQIEHDGYSLLMSNGEGLYRVQDYFDVPVSNDNPSVMSLGFHSLVISGTPELELPSGGYRFRYRINLSSDAYIIATSSTLSFNITGLLAETVYEYIVESDSGTGWVSRAVGTFSTVYAPDKTCKAFRLTQSTGSSISVDVRKCDNTTGVVLLASDIKKMVASQDEPGPTTPDTSMITVDVGYFYTHPS